MGRCDEILLANCRDQGRQFQLKLLRAEDEIVAFVNEHQGWGKAGKYDRWLRGSFNIGCVVKHPGNGNDGSRRPRSVLVRFPIPGPTYSSWCAEKVEDEVMVLEYLRQHTTIPLPRVYSWGPAERSPAKIAPFILMDFIDGDDLIDLMEQPREKLEDPPILDPDIDQKKLNVIYSQIADFVLQLSRLPLPRIGAISKDSGSGRWDVTRRPMTYDMNELVNQGIPADKLPSGPFNKASEYFRQRASELWTHLNIQRNICETRDDARESFVARRRLAQLIAKYCVDEDGFDGDGFDNDGTSFRLFSDDFGPFNMLADPDTLQITAVLDFEFTNAMPSQYTYDVPSWLLLSLPHKWLLHDDKAGFEKLFVPQMELFIHELERAEAMLPLPKREAHRLSTRMRESWATGRFWFNYAMRSSIDADLVFWKALDDAKDGNSFDEKEIEQFVETKMEQFNAYLQEKQNDPRFK